MSARPTGRPGSANCACRRARARSSASRTPAAPRFFRGWSHALPWDVDLLALQYPGREERFGEPCLTSIDALAGPAADALQRYAHAPLVLFGHSLGAALAYEVAARLEARAAPRCLAVSALPPPHRQRLSDLHLQSDDALVGDVARLSGEHAALLADPEMRALYLPMIRSDYRAIETYRRDRPPRLTTPLGVMLPLADSGRPRRGACVAGRRVAPDPHRDVQRRPLLPAPPIPGGDRAWSNGSTNPFVTERST